MRYLKAFIYILITSILCTTAMLLYCSLVMMPMVTTAVIVPVEARAELDRSAEERWEIGDNLAMFSSALIVLSLFIAAVAALKTYARKRDLLLMSVIIIIFLGADIILIYNLWDILHPPIFISK